MRSIFLLALVLVLGGCCYHNQKVILEEHNFKTEKRVLVYENSDDIADKLLRDALRKKDIKILKYTKRDILKSGPKASASKNDTEEIQLYQQYEGTPYLVDLQSQKRSDVHCLVPWDDGCVWNLDIEITNLTTREAVYSFSLSGLDKRCGYCSGGIFDEAADLIAKFWSQK